MNPQSDTPIHTVSILRSVLLLLWAVWALSGCSTGGEQGPVSKAEPLPQPGRLLYQTSFDSPESVSDWVMEGPGEIAFRQGWMEMHSPGEEGHHVFWCPEDFPDRFIARWEAQNLGSDLGLVIVFFAAMGADGQDIFDPELPHRDGTFVQYTEGEIKSYHISYYANPDDAPDRGHANLRKNNTFSLLQSGEIGIPTESLQEHEITLVKEGDRIRLYVDDRKVIDYTDDTPMVDGVDTGGALEGGKMGFRQMKWTHFRYRNLRVYALD